MYSFPYADFHCDTLTCLYAGTPENKLQNPISALASYPKVIQYFALFTAPELSDKDGYELFIKTAEYYQTMHLPENITPVLTIEDARILSVIPDGAAVAEKYGVRLLTPLWSGETAVGGSHNTDAGLTPFGKKLLTDALSRGMVLDISHASVRSADDIFTLSAGYDRPVVASHSAVYALNPHSRNLRDGQIDAVNESGGVIGLNLYPVFLSEDGKADFDCAYRHIDYFLTHGCRYSLALGCDLDGVDVLPDGLSTVADIPKFREYLAKRGMDETLLDDIFYGNLCRFTEKYILTKKV